MLEFKGLNIKMNDQTLFQSDDIALEKGLYALIGRNGAGKSTLFNTIIGAHKYFEGKIQYNTKSVAALGYDFAKTVAVVKTHPQIYGDHTVEDVLWLGRLPYQNLFGVRHSADQVLIEKVLKQLGLEEFKSNPYGKLSDGEKQLVMIGRALVQDTPIILLDEPLAFLDLVNQREVLQLLKEIGKDKLVIFSTHHIHQLNQYCNDVLFIHEGRLSLFGEGNDFSASINHIFKLD